MFFQQWYVEVFISKFSFKHFEKKTGWLFESLQLIVPNKTIELSSEILKKETESDIEGNFNWFTCFYRWFCELPCFQGAPELDSLKARPRKASFTNCTVMLTHHAHPSCFPSFPRPSLPARVSWSRVIFGWFKLLSASLVCPLSSL